MLSHVDITWFTIRTLGKSVFCVGSAPGSVRGGSWTYWSQESFLLVQAHLYPRVSLCFVALGPQVWNGVLNRQCIYPWAVSAIAFVLKQEEKGRTRHGLRFEGEMAVVMPAVHWTWLWPSLCFLLFSYIPFQCQHRTFNAEQLCVWGPESRWDGTSVFSIWRWDWCTVCTEVSQVTHICESCSLVSSLALLWTLGNTALAIRWCHQKFQYDLPLSIPLPWACLAVQHSLKKATIQAVV